jgi:hypothetical protein
MTINDHLFVKNDHLQSRLISLLYRRIFDIPKLPAMKIKFYISAILLLIFIGKAFSQITSNGVTDYNMVSNNANYNNFGLRTSFVIDNNGNKYIGTANTNGHSVRLVKFNDTACQVLPYSFFPLTKIYALAVDASNNLWVGTSYGLYKFQDTTNVGSYTGHPSANCLETAGGNVYIGSNSGLAVFNGSTYITYNRATNGMKSDTVLFIKYESPTAIWIGNSKGLEKFDGTSFTFYTVAGTQNDSVQCIYIDGLNNKWLGTKHNGVIKYDNTNFKTMQQLYGTPTGVDWPVNTHSISKGPGGGVFFQSMYMGLANNSVISAGSLEVLVAGSVKAYPGVAPSSGYGGLRYDLFQYDNINNKIYYLDINGSSYHFFHSFDASQYQSLFPTPDNSAYLDINNVQTLINPNDDSGWDMLGTKYFTPKGNNSSPLRAMSLWMGGFYNGSVLRLGAMTYRQNGYDFWPGPLDTTNTSTDTATSFLYNKVWKVNRFDIANFIYNWGAGNVQSGTFIPSPSILNWPAHGTGNYSRNLAPFVDVNSNGIYDPINDGDYPLIKGDQMIWWVFNDAFGRHSESAGKEIGVQIKASAYAYVCPNIADSNKVLNYTTFYDYKITNYSSDRLDSFYVAPWMDTDLGNYQDDYIGCNVMGNYGFTYNGDNYDEDMAGMTGYHSNLPAFSCNILSGPKADPFDGIDNDNNGVIDEANEKCLMHSFMDSSPNTSCPGCGNPSSMGGGMEYYNLTCGLWRNGTPITYGVNGAVPTNQPCRYLFPGNSDPYGIGLGGSIASPQTPMGSYGTTGWTQAQGGVVKNDMRFLIGVGPFTMQPQGTYEVEYALVFDQDSANCGGGANDCVLPRLAQDNNRIRNWYASNSFPSCLNLSTVSIKENKNIDAAVKLYPNPATDYLYIEFSESKNKVTVEVFDIMGKIVKAGTFNDERKYITLPVSELAKGLYTVKISGTDMTVTKKFVKD